MTNAPFIVFDKNYADNDYVRPRSMTDLVESIVERKFILPAELRLKRHAIAAIATLITTCHEIATIESSHDVDYVLWFNDEQNNGDSMTNDDDGDDWDDTLQFNAETYATPNVFIDADKITHVRRTLNDDGDKHEMLPIESITSITFSQR